MMVLVQALLPPVLLLDTVFGIYLRGSPSACLNDAELKLSQILQSTLKTAIDKFVPELQCFLIFVVPPLLVGRFECIPDWLVCPKQALLSVLVQCLWKLRINVHIVENCKHNFISDAVKNLVCLPSQRLEPSNTTATRCLSS